MHLHEIANSPRLLTLGGESFFVGRPTLRSHALLMERLAKVAPGASASDPAFHEMLQTDHAKVLIVWSALYRHQPHITAQRCAEIASKITEQEYVFLNDAYMMRPSSYQPESNGKPDTRSWSERLDLLRRTLGYLDYEVILDLTMDQITSLQSEGIPGEVLSQQAVEKRVAAAREKAAQDAAEGKAPEPPSPEALRQRAVAEAIERFEAQRKAANGTATEETDG